MSSSVRVVVALAWVLGGARARGQSRTIFDDNGPFTCSPDPSVACSGVLPLRRHPAAEVAVFSNGDEAFAARVATLKAAKRSIRIQALIFRGDEAGTFIAELLKQKKKAGVDVRVIVDAASNLEWKTQWMYFDLKRAGIEVEGYEALYLEGLTAERKASDPLRPNKRFHEKMWIIDGETPEAVAIVGGLNIANEYFRVDAAPLNRWRDQDVAVRGVIVKDIVTVFDRNYEFFKGLKAKLGPLFNPDNAWRLERAIERRLQKASAKTPPPQVTSLTAQVAKAAERSVPLAFRPVTARFIQSRPRLSERLIRDAYLDLIARAKERIYIANAYFVPPLQLVDALVAAAKRGVRVVILTNSPESNDITEVAVASRWMYAPLLERGAGGIEIHEWIGPSAGEGTLHAKYAAVDGKEALVGSYNLDPRSERLNAETALVISDEATAKQLEDLFVHQDLPHAKRISFDQARGFRRAKGIDSKFHLLFALPLRDWL